MILPRVPLQGCCLSCLWGGGCYPGVSGDDWGVCDLHAPWYPLEAGTHRSRECQRYTHSKWAFCVLRLLHLPWGLQWPWHRDHLCLFQRQRLHRDLGCPQPTWEPDCALGKGRGQSGVRGVFSRSWGKKALSRGLPKRSLLALYRRRGSSHRRTILLPNIIFFLFLRPRHPGVMGRWVEYKRIKSTVALSSTQKRAVWVGIKPGEQEILGSCWLCGCAGVSVSTTEFLSIPQVASGFFWPQHMGSYLPHAHFFTATILKWQA